MSSRKYANDYRLENVTSSSGKLKTVAVYNGAQYVFSAQPEAVKRARIILAVCVGIIWITQIAAFSLNTRCARCAWVVMPQAFILLALGFLTVGVWMMFTAKPKFNREFAEKTRDRVSGGAAMSLVLSSVTLVAAIAAAIVYSSELMLPADIIYLALLALSAAACAAAFVQRRWVGISQLPSEADQS